MTNRIGIINLEIGKFEDITNIEWMRAIEEHVFDYEYMILKALHREGYDDVAVNIANARCLYREDGSIQIIGLEITHLW